MFFGWAQGFAFLELFALLGSRVQGLGFELLGFPGSGAEVSRKRHRRISKDVSKGLKKCRRTSKDASKSLERSVEGPRKARRRVSKEVSKGLETWVGESGKDNLEAS